MSKEYMQALDDLFGLVSFQKSLTKEQLTRVQKSFDIIEEALQCLEAIDNANTSEALMCLERIDNTLCLNNIKGKLDFGIDTEEHTDCDSVIGMTEDLETIKQALLKAQEPKQYLKWEDLEFEEARCQYSNVKLGNADFQMTCYLYKGCMKKVWIRNEIISFELKDTEEAKQFFNDLHLERVEE